MPCRGPETDHAGNYDAFRADIDELTQLLCYSCGVLREMEDSHHGLSHCDQRLIDWAEEHHAMDERRVRREMTAERGGAFDPGELATTFIKRAAKVHPVSQWHKDWFHQIAFDIFDAITRKEKAQRAKEAVRNAAIEKLTDEERQALGV